jgi:hypothetical protein
MDDQSRVNYSNKPGQRHAGRKKLIAHVLQVEAETGVSILPDFGYLEDQFDAAVTAGDERVARNMAGLIEKKLREAV